MAKITQKIAQEIIDLYCQGSSSFELADKFGLWNTSISNIIRGHSWKKCKRPDNIKEIIKSKSENSYFKEGRICYIDAPPLTNRQMDIVVGSMLGDGTLSHSSKNSSFSKVQSKSRLGYLQWMESELCPYSSAVDPVYSTEKLIAKKGGVIVERRQVPKHLSGYNLRTHQHPNFTKLRNQWYRGNIKIIPKDLTLNPLRIAIWYFDDGCNSFDHRNATLCTQSFLYEEVEFLSEKLHEFNLYPTIVTVKSQYTGRDMPMLKFHSISYDNLVSLVKPFMLWDCFQHKIQWRPRIHQCEQSQAKLAKDDIINIFQMRKDGYTNVEIAKKYDVHKNHVSSIFTGKRWKHFTSTFAGVE
jgi:Mor family transcriptional regulator